MSLIISVSSEIKAIQTALRRVDRACGQAAKVFADADLRTLDDLAKATRAVAEALTAVGDRAQLPASEAYGSDLTSLLERLRSERADVDRRREQLAVAARAAGWQTEHTGARDFVGPFVIQHRPGDSTIGFGSFRLQTLKVPSGHQLLGALQAHRKKLEDEAKKGWDGFIEATLAAQGRLSAFEPVPWPSLVAEVIPDVKARRKAAKPLLFRLSMLLSGQAPGGHRIQVVPPVLSEQKSSLTVPRLDNPNEDVRVYRVRLS